MNNDLPHLLSVRRLPGRINADQVAILLGFMPHDIPILVKAKMLKPLGSPAQQAVKYFAAAEIEKLAHEEAWPGGATKSTYNHWVGQNQSRKTKTGGVMKSFPSCEPVIGQQNFG